MNTIELRNKLEQWKGKRDHLQTEVDRLKHRINRLRLKKIDIEKASSIIQIASKRTQEELKYRITEPVTLAIESIFKEDPHSLVAEFPIRRDRTECDLYFEQDGSLTNPLREGSGGMVDITSFALRASLINLHHPKPRMVIILDEPFKMLDREKPYLVGEMLCRVSKKLGMQIIMTTHSTELASCGDKIFKVKKDNKGRSFLYD